MDPILNEIDKALKNKGLSAAAASMLAAGHYSLIKNMKAAKTGGKRYSIETLEKLAEVLDLELYFGPPREECPAPETVIDGKQFAPVPRFEAQMAAGDGLLNEDNEAIEYLAFNREWLSRIGITPSQACLLNVKGDSMEPTLHSGDLVMVNRRRRTIRNNHIYAFNDIDGGSRIKRLEVVPDTLILLRSDNDDMPTEYRKGEDMNKIAEGIIGEVVWSGHKWN